MICRVSTYYDIYSCNTKTRNPGKSTQNNSLYQSIAIYNLNNQLLITCNDFVMFPRIR